MRGHDVLQRADVTVERTARLARSDFDDAYKRSAHLDPAAARHGGAFLRALADESVIVAGIGPVALSSAMADDDLAAVV